ncbi:MAG TPA: large conductance mechanosensitive channel protein MscL [Chloroflexi bacterium]|jgi:large conductance mechanosensitive channel|nr:large conductance mechanosensitive channel protein MscL [Chloroflexota bacterium]HAL25892.1 large conductance mechanosensitive channel protein MscL [Chloroflexota bacterium]
MWTEFRTFLVKTNVLALAIAFILGVAFAAVVASLVKDVIMPPVGMLLGKVDFSNLYINLSGGAYGSLADAQKAGAATINYGIFISTVVGFIIVAFVVFLVAKALIKPGPAEKECPYCGMTIFALATRCPHCTSQLATQAS